MIGCVQKPHSPQARRPSDANIFERCTPFWLCLGGIKYSTCARKWLMSCHGDDQSEAKFASFLNVGTLAFMALMQVPVSVFECWP